MPHVRIREIMDELTRLGGMTTAHMVLITELVAVCLAARPEGVTSVTTGVTTPSNAERQKAYRARKKLAGERYNASNATAIDNNINNSSIQEGGCGGKPKKRSVTTRGTRLPSDWNPHENLWSWGKEKLSEADLRFETAAFKDFWAAKPGAAGTKLDWDKTWKVWIREAVRRGKRFKPKNNVVEFVSSGPKRSWAEQKAEREGK
jgi:hypothetical protein